MRHAILALIACATPAMAQDLSPVLDPVQLGQGLTLSATMRAQANRDARRLGYRDADAYRRARSCRSIARTPRPTGERGIKWDRVRLLCRRAGYWPGR